MLRWAWELAGVGEDTASGFSGSSLRGAHHLGFSGRSSDAVVMWKQLTRMARRGLHVSCELGPPCKVKSDRFAVTRGYESLDLFVTS